MSSIFINGTKYSVATVLGAAIPVTALTNADPAVATATAPPADGSILVQNSGWSELDGTVVRSANAATTSFELEGVDTTDVVRFPAGQGVGSVRLASAFVAIDQVTAVDIAGGDPQFFQYQYVEDPTSRQRQKPTTKSPITITMSMDYDPAKAWYPALIAADRKKEAIVVRGDLPNGAVLLYYAFPSFNKEPVGAVNQNLQNKLVLSLAAESVRYGSRGMTFQIKANPAFPATLTLIGQGVEQKLNVVYRHKTTSDYQKLLDGMMQNSGTDVDLVLELVESWDADAPLSKESLQLLGDNQPGAVQAIIEAYSQSLQVGRRKN